MKRKSEYIVIVVVLVLGLSGMILWENYNKTTVLERQNLKDYSVEKIVEKLQSSQDYEIEGVVYGDRIVLEDAEGKQTLKLPKEDFYLSVAPYIYTTKPCEIFDLTKGDGEMKHVTFFVEVIDSNGNIILRENLSSGENGFVGIWLPRDINATLTVSYDSMIGTANISTDKDAPTCLTSLQLKY